MLTNSQLTTWLEKQPYDKNTILNSPAFLIHTRYNQEDATISNSSVHALPAIAAVCNANGQNLTIELYDDNSMPWLTTLTSSLDDIAPETAEAFFIANAKDILDAFAEACQTPITLTKIAKPVQLNPNTFFAGVLNCPNRKIHCLFNAQFPPQILDLWATARNLNPHHQLFAEQQLQALVTLAEFSLPASQLDSLQPGDHILLPELNNQTFMATLSIPDLPDFCATVNGNKLSFNLTRNTSADNTAHDAEFLIGTCNLTLKQLIDASDKNTQETILVKSFKLLRNRKPFADGIMTKLADTTSFEITAR